MEPIVSRQLWTVYEPFHAVTYFSPSVRRACEPLGLRGFWQGYFAMRSAPLGVVSADVLTALFFSFSPSMVARAVPGVWETVTPAEAWQARLEAVDGVLGGLLGGDADGSIRALAETADDAIHHCPVAGRALFAAHAQLERPSTPRLRLWLATTRLREHRGDGHVAAATAAGLDGLEMLVLADAVGAIDRAHTQPNRGWTDDEWAAAQGGLRRRGLVDDDGRAGPAGDALHTEIERATDVAALRPWEHIGPERIRAFHTAMERLARRIGTEIIRYPNAIGVPRP